MVQSRGEVVVLTAAFTALQLVAVAFRVKARFLKRLPLASDDFLIFAAAFSLVLFLFIPIITQCVAAGLGNHVPRGEDGHPHPPSYLFNVMELIVEAASSVPIACAKSSVLFFYIRIFRGSVFSTVVWAMIVATAVWCISFFFSLVFICTPVVAYLHSDPRAHCFNAVPLFYALVISDFIIDVVILIIPWPCIWKLHLSTGQKFAVTGVFMLGLLGTAASMVRLVIFIHASNLIGPDAEDYTYNTASTSYWTVIEASLAIVGACLPTLWPLLQDWSSRASLRGILDASARGHDGQTVKGERSSPLELKSRKSSSSLIRRDQNDEGFGDSTNPTILPKGDLESRPGLTQGV